MGLRRIEYAEPRILASLQTDRKGPGGVYSLDQAEDTEVTRLADKKTVESGRKTLEEARDVVARMTNDVGNAP